MDIHASRMGFLAVAMLLLLTVSAFGTSTQTLTSAFQKPSTSIPTGSLSPDQQKLLPVHPPVLLPITGPITGLQSYVNAFITTTGCFGPGIYVNSTTYFATTANVDDSSAGADVFTIQDNVYDSPVANPVLLQLVARIFPTQIQLIVEPWYNGWNGQFLVSQIVTTNEYPATAGNAIQLYFTYSQGSYVPNAAYLKLYEGGVLKYTLSGNLPSNLTSSLAYVENIVGAGDYSHASFTSGNGWINYWSKQSISAYANLIPLFQCYSLKQDWRSIKTGETSNINYGGEFSGQGTNSITQGWNAPLTALMGPGSTSASNGGHSYFALMTLDGSVQTMEKNYPSWQTYGGLDGGGGSNAIVQNRGFEAQITQPSGWTDYGIVNSTAFYFGASPAILSFQISTGPDYQGIPGEGRVVVAPTYQTSASVLNTNNYVDFCVCERYAEFNLKTSGVLTTIYKQSAESEYSAWVVVLGSLGVGISIYLNIGNGFQLVYNNSNLGLGFDYGYVYAFSRTNVWSTASFAYVSHWIPNNPLAEGTIDQNIWYLSRHYEEITSGSYAGTAVILDTDAPPLWVKITSPATAYLYAGMAYNPLGLGNDCAGNACNVESGVVQTTPTSQTMGYLFCWGEVCTSSDLASAEAGNSLSGWEVAYVQVAEYSDPFFSGQVDYTVTVTQCSSNCYANSYTVYLGGQAVSNQVVQTMFGLPGMRFVSRHITYVTGLLLEELGYSSVAQPLLNYIGQVMIQCGCQTPYEEFYSPMFPTVVNNSLLTPEWYDTYHAFPQSNFYSSMTDGAKSTFQIPNAAGYTQWSDPYISRLSLTGAETLWLGTIMAPWGYDATERAIWAEYKVNTANGISTNTNISRLENLLSLAGWNGVGTSEKVCFTQAYGQGPCYRETAYATFATAAFLSAASSVAGYDGDPEAALQANQAASVLESLLWSGNGSIAGDPNVQLLWQYTGGEDSAYNPVSPGSESLQYASNQQGLFGEVSDVLQEYGIEGVQPAESPGFQPVATEATGLTAAALLNYVDDLSSQVSQPSNGAYVASVGINLDTTISCSNPYDCMYSTADTGSISFRLTTTGDTMIGTIEMPYVVQQPVPAAFEQAIFAVNGTSSGDIYLYAKLVNSRDGTVVFSDYRELGTGKFESTDYIVNGQVGKTIPAGSYLAEMQFVAIGQADFMSNGGYIAGLGLSVVPNVISDTFMNDSSLNQGWANYRAGSGYCNTVVYPGQGLEVYMANATSTPFDCGVVSDLPISFDGGALSFSADPQLFNGFLTGAVLAFSPELAVNKPVTQLPDYVILEHGGDYIVNGTAYDRVITRSHGGNPVTTTIPFIQQDTSWIGNVYASGALNIFYSDGSQFVRVAGIPSGSFDTNFTSVYVYLYQEANYTGNLQFTVNFPYVCAEWGPNTELVSDSGQTSTYGAQWFQPLGASTQYPQTAPGINVAQFQASSNSYLASSGPTNDFDFVETVSFWMVPYTVGGNNPSGTGDSTMVVDNGGCCASWWFEYLNSGELDFKYTMSSGTTYAARSSFDLTNVFVPYFITGVYNSTGNSISLYINGFLQQQTSTAGVPDTTHSRTLYVGTGLCGPGAGCYDGYFDGTISGLSITPFITANPEQVAQLMVDGGLSGSHLGGGYWYPLSDTNGSRLSTFPDLFNAGPPLVSNNVYISQTISDFPYPWQSSAWNPYLEPKESSPNANNPYSVLVNQGVGTYGSCLCQGPSLEVSEAPGLSYLNFSGPVGGFNLAPVDLSTYDKKSPLILSFNYQTSASYANQNLFYLKITNSSGSLLYSNPYYQSVASTGWQTFNLNIASYVQGSQNIEIFLGLVNYWQGDYDQVAYFDNIQLYAPTQPSFYALSLYRYQPTVQDSPWGYSYTAQGAVEVPNYRPPTGAFSLSIWFEPVDVNFGDNPRIVANDHTDYGTDKNLGFEISYANGGGRLDMFLGSGTSFIDLAFTSAGLSNGHWYDVVMTYNGNVACGYLTPSNGQTQSVCQTIGAGYSLNTGHYPISVGFDPQYQGDFFAGAVSDLRIYNYTLSAYDASQLAANGPTNPKLPPNSLWLLLDGSFADNLGTGITAVPYIGNTWYENYASFTPEM